ncbi:MAG: type II toxin-antitoxin system RelE/ParE family toxin [Candidatus Omnitrophica bacterium]|nr:type II toxin-antitoxin system RelE/ParE family toxin [Candidatus Omnitrophota bacterium]
MEILYRTKKLEKILQDKRLIQREYGADKLKKIVLRLEQLSNANTLQDIEVIKNAKLHPLHDDYKGFFAVKINKNYRLIFEPMDGENMISSTITIVKIEKIEDYH